MEMHQAKDWPDECEWTRGRRRAGEGRGVN